MTDADQHILDDIEDYRASMIRFVLISATEFCFRHAPINAALRGPELWPGYFVWYVEVHSVRDLQYYAQQVPMHDDVGGILLLPTTFSTFCTPELVFLSEDWLQLPVLMLHNEYLY